MNFDKKVENINFKTGKVIYKVEYLQEDILQVEYRNNFILDMGWYLNKFIIYVIKDYNWEQPIATYITKDKDELIELLTVAVDLIEKINKTGSN